MFAQYFGQYLLNNRILTPQQLQEVLDYQQTTNVKLGLLAVASGAMTAAQVTEVHERQRRTDRRFGEIAVDLGYLTPAQLEDLLAQQQSGHVYLGQAVVEKKFLTLQQLEVALRAYKKEAGLNDYHIRAMQQGDVDTVVRMFVQFQGPGAAMLYDYVGLLLRNFIRFLDAEPRLGANTAPVYAPGGYYVRQDMHGERGGLTSVFGMDELTFGVVASRFSGEPVAAGEPLALAAVGEFVNQHNGLFSVNMSDAGVELTMTPQQVVTDTAALPPVDYRVPLHLSWGGVDVFLRAW